jgi:hypothetical protein
VRGGAGAHALAGRFALPELRRSRALRGRARKTFQCNAFRHRASSIAGTLSEGAKLKPTVWFLAIYLVGEAKTGL